MRFRPRVFRLSVFLFPCALLCGCTILGVAAYKLKPPETIKPKYTNLVNQTVGVMVWADQGVRIEWPTLQLDIANGIDHKIRAQTVDDKGKPKAKSLLGVAYPYPPASFVRYQQDHPETQAMSITDLPSTRASSTWRSRADSSATCAGDSWGAFNERISAPLSEGST